MDIRFIIAIAMLSIATINDYKERKVKNIIPAIMIVLGIIANMFFYQDVNLLHSLLISFVYFFSLFFIPRLFHINEFMGAGDIKLLMATSFLLGWKFSLYTFLYSVIIGSIILVILNLRRIREIGLNIAMFFISKGKWLIDESQNKTNMFTTYILIGCILEFFIQYDWLFLHIFNF